MTNAQIARLAEILTELSTLGLPARDNWNWVSTATVNAMAREALDILKEETTVG